MRDFFVVDFTSSIFFVEVCVCVSLWEGMVG